MDSLIGLGFVIFASLLVIGVIWGALLLLRDHTLWAVILFVAGGVPLVLGGAAYALFITGDKSLRQLTWGGFAGLIFLVIISQIIL